MLTKNISTETYPRFISMDPVQNDLKLLGLRQLIQMIITFKLLQNVRIIIPVTLNHTQEQSKIINY
jgi:hypothetical protein